MKFAYNVALHFLALLALPKVLYGICVKGKYRKSFFKRWGVGFPRIEKDGRPLIWIHAVSLGETKAITPLITRLKQSPSNPQILLTTVTETGYSEALKAGADVVSYMPLDFSYCISAAVKKAKPTLVLLTESDFWYNFQMSAQKEGAKLALVNGKLSLRSFNRLQKVPFFAKALFAPFSLFCVQGQSYAARFAALGVSPQQVEISGNIKLDGFSTHTDGETLRKRLHLEPQDLVFTCGSTHDPEEKIVLQMLPALFNKFPHLKVLIVPRHPERFEVVARLLEKSGLPWGRLSDDSAEGKRVILVDAMGHLRACYSVSHVAFVGGSLTPRVGGHNILEPGFYGVPVLFGPYMHTQPDFLDLVRSYGAGEEVTQENFLVTVEKYLENPKLCQEVGEKGRCLIEESRGALDFTYRKILSLLEKTEPC